MSERRIAVFRLGSLCAALVTLSLLAPHSASALIPGGSIQESRLSFGVQAGYNRAKDAEKGKTITGAHAELHLSRLLGVQASIGYRKDETYSFRTADRDLLMDVTSVPITASAKLYLPVPLSLTPYALAGAGWYRMDYSFSSDAKALLNVVDYTETSFGWHLGAGAALTVLPQVAVFGEYRAIFVDPKKSLDSSVRKQIEALDFDSTNLRAGVSVFF